MLYRAEDYQLVGFPGSSVGRVLAQIAECRFVESYPSF